MLSWHPHCSPALPNRTHRPLAAPHHPTQKAVLVVPHCSRILRKIELRPGVGRQVSRGNTPTDRLVLRVNVDGSRAAFGIALRLRHLAKQHHLFLGLDRRLGRTRAIVGGSGLALLALLALTLASIGEQRIEPRLGCGLLRKDSRGALPAPTPTVACSAAIVRAHLEARADEEGLNRVLLLHVCTGRALAFYSDFVPGTLLAFYSKSGLLLAYPDPMVWNAITPFIVHTLSLIFVHES